ncbi:hypothetical protein CS8_037040 [Cupriavidus sp. 8B]
MMQPVGRPGDLAQAQVKRAEVPREGQLRLRRQRLLAKHQYAIGVHGMVYRFNIARGEWLGKVEAFSPGNEVVVDRRDG